MARVRKLTPTILKRIIREEKSKLARSKKKRLAESKSEKAINRKINKIERLVLLENKLKIALKKINSTKKKVKKNLLK
jgi:hypothetical protein